jgi:hypothetical protein
MVYRDDYQAWAPPSTKYSCPVQLVCQYQTHNGNKRDNDVLSTHGRVEEEETHVCLFLGFRESTQGNEVLLLPLEELGVHVRAGY